MVRDWRAPTHLVVVYGLILLHILTILQEVVNPTHQPVWSLKIKCFFIPAVVIAGSATVSIGQGQGESIRAQRAAKAQRSRPPNLIDHITEVVVGARQAIAAMDDVRSRGQRDGGKFGATGLPCSSVLVPLAVVVAVYCGGRRLFRDGDDLSCAERLFSESSQ